MSIKRIRTKQDAINLVKEQHRNHRGKWLTQETAEKYRKRACALGCPTYKMKGEMRQLMLELIEEYGVTEVEAVNILSGHRIGDYINKYYRIKNLIPLNIKEKGVNKKDDEWE